MSDTALNPSQVREVEQVAKIEVRQYFDHYLQNVVPVQQKTAREHVHLMIEKHDADRKAHGGTEVKVSRLLWMVTGAATVGGTAGAGLLKLVASLG